MTNVTQISTVAKASSSWLINIQKVRHLQDWIWKQNLMFINNYQRKSTIQKAAIIKVKNRIQQEHQPSLIPLSEIGYMNQMTP